MLAHIEGSLCFYIGRLFTTEMQRSGIEVANTQSGNYIWRCPTTEMQRSEIEVRGAHAFVLGDIYAIDFCTEMYSCI